MQPQLQLQRPADKVVGEWDHLLSLAAQMNLGRIIISAKSTKREWLGEVSFIYYFARSGKIV